MDRILIDLTDIELWTGNHGGTQRVVYGIAKNFYKNLDNLNRQVCFISFDSKDQQFYLSNFEPIYNRVEKIQVATADNITASYVSAYHPGIKQSIKKITPALIINNKTTQRSLRIVKNKLQSGFLKAQLNSQVAPIVKEREWVKFTNEDTVLMLGKPWDDPNIQKTLTNIRREIGIKVMQIVYDLVICFNPQLHHPSWTEPYTHHMIEVIKNSDKLMCISEWSAKDLSKLAVSKKLVLPEIRIIRLGDDVKGQSQTKLLKPDARIKASFIACIGTLEIRKNHALLYYVYKLATQRHVVLPQLVLVGSKGWLSDDIQYMIAKDPDMYDRILILDNLDDDGLSWIYKNCLFTVYPSMYEGWGLPVAESLASGKVCVASSASSIPEIGGDLVDYFSPYSTDECLLKIDRYLDEKTRTLQELRICNMYKPTGWDETYKQVLNVI